MWITLCEYTLCEYGTLLIKRLDNSGLKVQPWRTGLVYWKDLVLLIPIFIEHEKFEHKLFINF